MFLRQTLPFEFEEDEFHSQQAGRVRPPRVHITYDVEIGDATKKVELPFVMGVIVISRASQINRSNRWPIASSSRSTKITIDSVLKSMTPALSFDVDNLIDNDGTQIPIT